MVMPDLLDAKSSLIPMVVRHPMAVAVVVQKLGLHPRHVDAGRALPPTGFAAYAQRHGLGHGLRGQCVWSELAGDRQAERVGAASGRILLITGCTVGGHITAASRLRQAPLLLHISTAPENPPQLDQSSCVGRLPSK